VTQHRTLGLFSRKVGQKRAAAAPHDDEMAVAVLEDSDAVIAVSEDLRAVG
jgi:hypothetical protein